MIKSFEDLPIYMKEVFMKWENGDKKKVEHFVNAKIPILNNKSIIQSMNEPEGENKVIEYFNQTMDKMGVPLELKKPE